MADHQAGQTASFFVRAADQSGDGHSVLVEDAVFAQQSGWIVIHLGIGGAPGPILGVSSLQGPGEHVNVPVPLRAPLATGAYLFVMLHTEDGGDDRFDYPTSDQPAVSGGQTVMVPIYLAPQR
jgi:hypothetical protein